MLNKFSTKELVFAALMGALMFVLSFVLGSGLNVAIGNPAASGLISCLVQSILMTIAVLMTKRFGITTIMFLVYGILAIPTNMLGNLPGIIKVPFALSIGLVFDIVVHIFKYKKWSFFAGFVVMYIFLVPATLVLYLALGMPGAEVLLKSAHYLFAIFLIESFIGIWLGMIIYGKIKDKTLIRQISQ